MFHRKLRHLTLILCFTKVNTTETLSQDVCKYPLTRLLDVQFYLENRIKNNFEYYNKTIWKI